jgi:methyl coenzyme M reductase subunit C
MRRGGLAERFAIAASGYVAGEQARVVGCVIHGLPAAGAAAAAGTAGRPGQARLSVVAAVPYRPGLTWPGCAIWYATCTRGSCMRAICPGRIRDVAVFAQGIPGGIHALDTGRLVVVPATGTR